MLLMGINMGAVKKAIAYTAGAAIAGLVFYELSRMMKRKTETGPTEMERTEPESYETMPREPGDYRSIYNL
jgi:hypothetical protein